MWCQWLTLARQSLSGLSRYSKCGRNIPSYWTWPFIVSWFAFLLLCWFSRAMWVYVVFAGCEMILHGAIVGHVEGPRLMEGTSNPNEGYIPPTFSEWWFGTFSIFPYIGNNHQKLTNTFHRGWNHQPVLHVSTYQRVDQFISYPYCHIDRTHNPLKVLELTPTTTNTERVPLFWIGLQTEL